MQKNGSKPPFPFSADLHANDSKGVNKWGIWMKNSVDDQKDTTAQSDYAASAPCWQCVQNYLQMCPDKKCHHKAWLLWAEKKNWDEGEDTYAQIIITKQEQELEWKRYSCSHMWCTQTQAKYSSFNSKVLYNSLSLQFIGSHVCKIALCLLYFSLYLSLLSCRSIILGFSCQKYIRLTWDNS